MLNPSNNKKRIYRINGKLYDFGTSNRSFLQVAKDLKSLGVKNWYFMLEIVDYSLTNVDPFAEDKNGHSTLSQDQVTRVMTECFRNPWYYLREIARIPDPGGVAVPYLANRGNIAQAWCITKGIDSWLCLPRQQGKTQSALAMQDWMYSFGTTQSQFIFINKDGDNAKTNLRRMRDQIDLLPEYMRFDSFTDEDGKIVKATKNATQMRHPVNGNSVIIKSKATSYDSALSLARGLTAPILHFKHKLKHYIVIYNENSFNCWELSMRQSAAKNLK